MTREDHGPAPCRTHGVVEPIERDGFRCPDCRHGYATAQELVDAYNQDVVWLLNRVREPGRPPLRPAASVAYVSTCPNCDADLPSVRFP